MKWFLLYFIVNGNKSYVNYGTFHTAQTRPSAAQIY